ncbi:hypothetical protein JB92DRAFT_350704 [Gautieria morchelliformis]|nr:hypothetical protein JB92DRAFT_350704 [Gautieria morchelliformis]
MSMAVVSPAALSPDWPFPAPIGPFDAPASASAAAFAAHLDLEHTHPHTHTHTAAAAAAHLVHHKRRAHEIDWDAEDALDRQRAEGRAKKARTAPCPCAAVDPHQLHLDSVPPAVAVQMQAQATPPPSPSPQMEQVISILVDALTSGTSTPSTQTQTTAPGALPDPPLTVLSSPLPVPAAATGSRSPGASRTHTPPTSPLSDAPHRAPFVRKVIGGSCAGRTEPKLYRWVLCKNHFLRIRYVDPTTQTDEWMQALHELGWEELHPYFQAQAAAAAQNAQTLATLGAFSRWIKDDFDYDGDGDAEWSDEDEDGELQDQDQDQDHDQDQDQDQDQDHDQDQDQGQDVHGGAAAAAADSQTGVVLQLPGKSP